MINSTKLMTITDAAASRIQDMINARENSIKGIRIFIKNRGCSGLSYGMEYVDQKRDFDEEIIDKGITLFIDPKAVMFILGSKMDYEEGLLESGFLFKNPNEKGRCGCGESFHV